MMLRALLTIGAVQVLTMLVLLVRTKTLAVTLGPELVGVMGVIEKLLALVVQTASLSLPFAALRYLPQRWSAGPAEYRDLFARMRNVILAALALATVAALGATFAAPQMWGEALLPYRDVVLAALLGLPALGLVPFLQSAVAGRLEKYRAMTVGFAHAVVLTLAMAGIWLGGLAGYYAAYAVLGTAFAFAALRLATAGTPPPQRAQASFSLPTEIWRFSTAMLALAFLVPYATLFAHYRILAEHGAATAGWMQAAVGISLSVRAVLGSAHAFFLTPNVNRGGTPADRMAWANGFQATLCVIIGVVVPPLLLFPELVVHLLYSADFLAGAPYVMVFVLSEILILLSGTYQSLVLAFDHLRFHVASNLAAQLLVVAIAYALVGPLGILGAGLAALSAPVVLLVSTLLFLSRRHGLQVPAGIVARCGWLFGSLLISGIMGNFLPGLGAGEALAKLCTYLAVIAGFAILLTPGERARARLAFDNYTKRWK